MQILKIQQNENGSHDNQTIYNTIMKVPYGWCLVPDEMQSLENFPFGDITTETIKNPGSPYGDEYEQLLTWEPLPIPEPEPAPEPEPSEQDWIEAQVLWTAVQTNTLLED